MLHFKPRHCEQQLVLTRSCTERLSALLLKLIPPALISSHYSLSRHTRLSSALAPISCPWTEKEESTNCGFQSLSNHPNPEISCFSHKGFSHITQEIVGRAVHALCIKGLIHSSVFYTNTLVSMYSKFGHLNRARLIFGEMTETDEASWNSMMSAYVRAEVV